MTEQLEHNLWMAHESRITEVDRKADENRAAVITIEKELRQLIERINMGISPTQNKIFEKAGTIEVKLAELDHKFDLKFSQIETKMDLEFQDVKHKQEDHDEWFRNVKNIFIYGIVITIVAAISMTVYNKVVSDRAEVTNVRKK